MDDPNKQLSPSEAIKNEVEETAVNLDEQFIKDIAEEMSFIEHVKDATVFDKIESETSKMIFVLNEQVESLCRLRFDLEIYTNLEKIDYKKYHEKRLNAQASIALRRVTVQTIRKQLMMRHNALKQLNKPKET